MSRFEYLCIGGNPYSIRAMMKRFLNLFIVMACMPVFGFSVWADDVDQIKPTLESVVILPEKKDQRVYSLSLPMRTNATRNVTGTDKPMKQINRMKQK